MSRLTRGGTAEPVSRDQIFRHARGQGNNITFPVQLTTSRIGNLTRLIHTLLYVMTIHTYIQRRCCYKQTKVKCEVINNILLGVYKIVRNNPFVRLTTTTYLNVEPEKLRNMFADPACGPPDREKRTKK